MTPLRRISHKVQVLTLVLALAVTAFLSVSDAPPELGSGSRYMGLIPDGATAERPFDMAHPEDHILIVYLNGSTEEPKPDPCDTSAPGINIPRTATDLDGQVIDGRQILVYAFCTRSKIGGFNQPNGDGVPKVIHRATELERLLIHITEQGFPPERLFVMGQSAGAWAGLLVQRDGKAPFAGLIGFAPAFAGHHGRRSTVWQVERDRQAAHIAEAPRLEALIYGFEQDWFEPVRAMGWLAAVPGIRYVAISGRSVFGFECGGQQVHGTVFKDCFRYFQRHRILSFIRDRLPVPDVLSGLRPAIALSSVRSA